MKNYTMILKYGDDSLGKVEVSEEELPGAIEEIENKGTQIILLEENA